MQRRAQLIVGCLAILGGIALGRSGLIDAGRQPAEPVVVTLAPTRPEPAGSAADADRDAVRRWLHDQLQGASPLGPGRVTEALVVVDEDTKDTALLRVLPSGRLMPKAAGGEAWQQAGLWPERRGVAPGSMASSDLHNVRAVERDVVAVVADVDFTDDSGPGQLEPGDSVKGDVARALFYMALRYDGSDGGPRLDLVVGTGRSSGGGVGELCTLLRWNEEDRVDVAERRRNERVARYQGNRNPFVDRPEFARVLWGHRCEAS
jgi:hypothetical protein